MRIKTAAALFCLWQFAFLFPRPALAQAASGVAPYLSDPKFVAALSEAQAFMTHRQPRFAADAFRKANKIAGGQCLSCLKSQYSALMAENDFKAAIATATAMDAVATTPSDRSNAKYFHANALFFSAGDKPKTDKLETVHGLLSEALGLYPKSAAALYLDGQVMALLGKMDEAKADFASCVSCVSEKDPARLRAEHFAENPELALHKMAPPFEVTALDGSRFNLDAMGGRVVLIDFWATWCGPCNQEIPHMQQIAKEFAGEPLVIISVSWDSDEAKWKDFIAKHGMTWVQYRDADHKLSNEFGVNAIPHYFTIDSDGVLTAEILGSGSNVEGKLKNLLAKAHAALTQGMAA